MKILLEQKFNFLNYSSDAFLIDFKHFNVNFDKMNLHEEISKEILDNDKNIIDTFEPIIAMTLVDKELLFLNNQVEINNFYLLDGHHRWNFALRTNQVSKLNCVLVSFSDVKIDSFKFQLNIEFNKFESLLNHNRFKISKLYSKSLKFNNLYYSSEIYKNKLDLYNFKRELQENNIITPIVDQNFASERVITFAPIEINEIVNLNYLLPPKSTWITPRI